MPPLVPTLLAAGAGTLATGLGLWLRGRANRLEARGVRTRGVVVAASARTVATSDGASVYPVIEFRTAEGRVVTFEGRAGGATGGKLGREVPVLYDPAEPEEAVVDSWIERRAPEWIFLLTGLGILATTIVLAALGR